MTVFLVPNPTRPQAAEVTRVAAQTLREDGVRLLATPDAEPVLTGCEGVEFLPLEQAMEACDILLTIGGDGTILHAARSGILQGKPLLGINTGRLGFLTIIEKDEMYKLHRLSAGEYTVEHRSLLEVACGEAGYSSLALNDVVLAKVAPEATVELDIYCDDILVSSVRGDGVVFATPTGSTAYSMSAGGPIVDARLGGIIVTQICAHILQMPPMVFAPDRVMRVVHRSEGTQRLCITADGLPSEVLAAHSISIRTSTHTVPLVQFVDADQLKSIDKKLKGR